ncbi:PQQ-dependent sugar dehydrogenase [Actinocorallia lasiicapitis]
MDLRRLSVTVAAAGLVLTACSDDPAPRPDPGPPSAGATSTAPAARESAPVPQEKTARQEAPGKIALRKVAELDQPVGLAVRKGDPTLYVIEQPGRVRTISGGKAVQAPVLDLTGQVGSGGERGLLGIAFAPDGKHVYLDYTNKQGDTEVVEYKVTGNGAFDADSRRLVLTQKQPYANHNGGQLAFDKAGLLYIGLGDGGSGGDPQGNGQNLGTFLGKILRIDPRGARPYKVPPSNPFVGKAGAKPEIWAYGLRNPWRFSFDAQTGDLWIGDVGQDSYEEVDFQPAASKGGENYGWNLREGGHPFKNAHPAGVEPVLEYKLKVDNACSVIGGYVYRGQELVNLTGRYLYADFCAGWIKAVELADGKVSGQWELAKGLNTVAAFGQDGDRELYVLSLDGSVSKLVSEG